MADSASTPPDPIRRIGLRAWVVALVFALLLCQAFRVPIAWMIDRWTAAESYYSHGFLVPLVVLYWVWRDRRDLLERRAERSWLGLALMLAGLFVLTAGGLISFFSGATLGLILVLWGLCGFLFGRAVLRRLVFPAFLLTFMVPLPLSIIEDASLRLKLLATDAALILLDAVGVLATNDGSTIYLGNGAVVTVGAACSGLRSLISLLLLGLIFAALSALLWPRRAALFLLTIPIALVANVVRVFMLCLIASNWGAEAITGFVHDASGYLIFIVAFLLLFGASTLLGWGIKPAETAEEQAPAPADAPGPAAPIPASNPGLRRRTAASLVMLGLMALFSATILFPEHMDSGRNRAAGLPLALGRWTGEEVPVEDYVKEILETEDVIQRNYTNPLSSNIPVQLAVVFSADNRRVAHPPEVCYRGSGWEVADKRMVRPAGLPEMVRLTLDGGAGKRDIVYYCYKTGDRLTANYYRQQVNIIANHLLRRATASALIRISSPVIDSETATEQRLADFTRQMIPEIQKHLRE